MFKTHFLSTFYLLLCAALAFMMGFYVSDLSLRTFLFLSLGVAGGSIFVLPYHRAIQVLFVYLGIEGFAKLVTNYNPVVHVGADILVLVLVARFFVVSIFSGGISIRETPPFTALLSAHFLWFFIAVANPFALSLVASLAAGKMYVTMPLLFFFGYFLTDKKERITQFIVPWILVCILQSVSSIYQSIVGPKSVLWISPLYSAALVKFKGYAFRPFGFSALPGGPSIYLYMTVPFFLYLFVRYRSFLIRTFMILALSCATVALLFCQVRSAILKALVGLGMFFIILGRFFMHRSSEIRRTVLGFTSVIALLFTIGAPILVKRLTSENDDISRAIGRSMSLFDLSRVKGAREGAMDRFLLFAQQAPLGAGLSRTGAAAGKFAGEIQESPYFKKGFFTDNFWVATVVDLGIPGMLLLTVLIFGILFKGAFFLNHFSDPMLGAAHGALLCALGSITLGFYGAEAVLYNPEAAFFWFFSGVLMRLPGLDRASANAPMMA